MKDILMKLEYVLGVRAWKWPKLLEAMLLAVIHLVVLAR